MSYTLVAVNGRFSHSCLALFYLRQELARHLPEQELKIRQLTINDPYYDTLLSLSAGQPAVIFFSVYIWSAEYIARLLPDLARILPATRFVLGGPQAGALDPEQLPPRVTLFLGEIEGAPAAFYQELRDATLKPLYRAAPNPPFASPYLDADFAQELRNRQVYFESSRGCPFFCSYCLSSLTRAVRQRELAPVQAELEALLLHQPRMIKFVDRTFNTDPARAVALWQFLAAQAGPSKFHFEIAPDRFTEEMFQCLAAVPEGRFQFEIGIQSTNPATLAAVNRTMDWAQARSNLARLVALDTIHIHADLIIGLPEEEVASFRNSFNELFALRPHQIQMGLLKLLPGTALREQSEAHGFLFCQHPPYELLASRWLSHPELSQLHWLGETVEAFYNNRFFSKLWDYLQRQDEDAFAFFDSLRKLCQERGFFALAKTQELMNSLLLELAASRPDRELLVELLRFAWLHCGHRFLPPELLAAPLNQARDQLWHSLPPALPGLYTAHGRNEFFKRAVFAIFSPSALAALALAKSAGPATVCFLPENSKGVIKHCQILLFPGGGEEK